MLKYPRVLIRDISMKWLFFIIYSILYSYPHTCRIIWNYLIICLKALKLFVIWKFFKQLFDNSPSTSPIETGRVRARSPFTPARPRCEEDAPRIRMKAQTSIRNLAFFSPERLKKCFYLANLLLVLAFVSTADWRGQMTFELIFVWQYYLYSDTYNIIQYKIQ